MVTVVINITKDNYLIEQLEITATSVIIKEITPLDKKHSYHEIQVGNDKTLVYRNGTEVTFVKKY